MYRFTAIVCLLAALAAGCSKEEPESGVTATLVETGTGPRLAPATPKPAPKTRDRKPDPGTGIIAQRGYERLLRGKRAEVVRVTWSWAEYEGRRVIRDQTRSHSRTARVMLSVKDVFERSVDIDLFRTESGELLAVGRGEQLGLATAGAPIQVRGSLETP